MKGITLIFCLFGLASSALSVAPIEKKSPLMLAAQLADHIENDTDIKADTKLRIIDQLLAKRQFAEAVKLIESLTDYRRAIGYLRKARAEWLADPNDDPLKAALDLAKPYSARGEDLAKDFASLETALTLALVDLPAAHSTCRDIVDQELKAQAELEIDVIRTGLGHGFDLEKHCPSIKAASAKGPFPGGLAAATALLKTAVSLAKEDKPKALQVAASANELASLCGVEHCQFSFDLSQFYFLMEDEAAAKKAFAEALKDLQALPDGYELKATLHASWARLWLVRGKLEAAIEILTRGAALAEKLEPMHQPAVFASIAGGFAQCKEDSLAKDYFEKAAGVAAKNPNLRVGLLGGIEICLVHNEIGRGLDPSLMTSLLQMAAATAPTSEP